MPTFPCSSPWRIGAAALLLAAALTGCASPRVVVISLDGAAQYLVDSLRSEGALPDDKGLGRLERHGVVAAGSETVNPSLTAASHIAIATGSTAARNNVPGNTFHLHASPFGSNVSGFSAPIGGYAFAPGGTSQAAGKGSVLPTAEPLWLRLRQEGKRVVAATWPGADALDVRAPGRPDGAILQPATERTVDYTVPFGIGAAPPRGYVLDASDFEAAPPALRDALVAAGAKPFGEVRHTRAPLEELTVGGRSYTLHAVAFDGSDDGMAGFDTLVVFDATAGIGKGPFVLPATGPAWLRVKEPMSQRFHFDGSTNDAGTAFYLTAMPPDLVGVRLVRYGASAIPRREGVAAIVDEVNRNVGFWAPQPDYRIPERLLDSLRTFPDEELEAVYLDQMRTFVDYQVSLLRFAIERNPEADLVLGYIEQPDGAGHMFLMADPRQASDARDGTSIGVKQDAAKRARFRRHLALGYQVANEAIERIVNVIGVDRDGVPRRNVLVVSDHGMAPFHTAVDLRAHFALQGIRDERVRIVTTGPAVHVYIRLASRDGEGGVSPAEYRQLQARVVLALRTLVDHNERYSDSPTGTAVFDQIHSRPVPEDAADPRFGLGTDPVIGQDSGDVYAVLAPGYNFDGRQSPLVRRQGDDPNAPFSVPNFYGAHGYDPALRPMHAIFYAAGPEVCRGRVERMRNIDVAPTIAALLGVKLSATVEGRAVDLCPPRR